tara:strand:+ start:3400 stop:4596 length:1197 start_codon:yes stop_codon:yes gene_type:complete
MGFFDQITNLFSGKSKKRSAYIDPNRFYFNSNSGAIVNKTTALGFTPVFNAVRLLSESISQIPLEICEKTSTGDIIKRNDHPLSRILTLNPNANQTKVSFFSKIIVDLCLDGNSYVFIERNGSGVPVDLYCINADHIEMKYKDKEIFYQNKDDGTVYANNELLHFKTLSTNGYLGVSPIEQCKNAIGWGLAVETYGNTFFKNGAKLSGVLSTDRQMSELSIERLKTSFQEQYANLNDANKTLILEEGLKFQSVAISNEQAQFLASRDMAIQEIARVYNIPPHMLKDLSKSSFNNIEQQSAEFVRYTVQPYLSILESEMDLKLFKQNEQGKMFTNFDVNGLLRGSPNDRASFYQKMITIGAMTVNEVRDRENMNRVDSGDELYLPKNMDTLDEINKEEN